MAARYRSSRTLSNEIKDHIYLVSEGGEVDVVISEIGGTIGDMEGQPFIEAIRQVSLRGRT